MRGGSTRRCFSGVKSMLRTKVGFALALFGIVLLGGCKDKRAPLQTQPVDTNRSAPGTAEAEGPPPSPAERDEALKRLDKAIAAHGGIKALAKLQTIVQKMKGSMYDPNRGSFPTEQELKIQFPDRLRLSSKISTPEGIKTVYIGVNRDSGWYGPEASIVEMPDDTFTDQLGELYLRRAQTLIPLRDEEFRLKPVNGIEVDGKPTVGIRVIHKKWPSLNLYFDQESSLLVRSVGLFIQAKSKSVREMNFLDYKSFGDLTLPTRFVERLDYVTRVECTIDYSFPTKIDEKEFEKP